MTHHIFFSWQSDTERAVGLNFIEKCLGRAIKELKADAEIDPADREMDIDRDTKGVPGSPAIVDTIFGKIDQAAVFLSDLTYVAVRTKGGGRTPNPNVCIEHGYALKALGSRRVIAVMNIAMGDPQQHELPFDVRHTRRPMTYNLTEGADDDARQAAADELVPDLKRALRAVLQDAEARASMQEPGPATPHPHDVELLKRVQHQLPQRMRHLLQTHDFGGPYLRDVLDPLFEMNEDWTGASFEFHDAVVQAAFGGLRKVAYDFGTLVVQNTHAMDSNMKMAWPKTNRDLSHGLQPGTRQAIKDMNAAASDLTTVIDQFDRIARDRIPIATGVHAVEVPAREEPGAARAVQRDAAEAALNNMAGEEFTGAVPEIVSQPRLTLRLAPFASTDGKRLDTREVAKLQHLFVPAAADRAEADTDGRQWWSCGPSRRPAANLQPETRWRMRLVRPGYLEFQATVGARVDDDEHILVDGRRLEAMVVSNLERMGQIAAKLGLGGPALVSVGLGGVEAVELTGVPAARRLLRFRRPDVPLATLEVDDGASPLADALHETFDILWQTAGAADGSPSYEGEAWSGYADHDAYAPNPLL